MPYNHYFKLFTNSHGLPSEFQNTLTSTLANLVDKTIKWHCLKEFDVDTNIFYMHVVQYGIPTGHIWILST